MKSLPLGHAVPLVLCFFLLGLVCLPFNAHGLFALPVSSCLDADGDGLPDNPATDRNGRRYCLEIQAPAAIVGLPTPVSIRAYHEDGLSRIELVQDFNYTGKQTVACNGSAWCSYELPLSLGYVGTLSLTANLFLGSDSFAASTTKHLSFKCATQTCAGDPREENFASWMRSKGYPECLVERYISWYRTPAARQSLLPFLEDRRPEDRLSSKQVIHLYDIIPTDSGATFTALAEGTAPLCTRSFASPAFCQIPRPADYHFLEAQLEVTFGVDIEIIYHALPVNYAETFGAPILSQQGFQKKYIYGSRRSFLASQNFEPHSIVHYAIDRYQGELIGDMTGASAVAEVGVHPSSIFGMRVYSHELGHTFGLPHPFAQSPYRQFQLDGIMSNTYGSNSIMNDPTDPLERYALEPRDGTYLDDAIFADTYSQAVIGSRALPQCSTVIKPKKKEFHVIRKTPAGIVKIRKRRNLHREGLPRS